MKKLFALILALAMVLALAACGETIGDVSVDEGGIVNSGDGESSSGNQDYSNDELQDIPENSSDKDSDYTEDRADEDTTEVHTHSYASVVTAPSCTEKGYTTHTCSCGDSYTDNETDATGHNYSDATCSAAATCSCGATNGTALGHAYSGGKCTRCNASDPDYVQQDTNSGTVYVTETGKRYHSTKHCTGLNNANKIFDSTLSAAKDRGLTACNKCY